MKLVALFVVLLWSGVAHAQKEPIGFKDFPLGGSVEAFKERFPDFACERGACRYETRMCTSQLMERSVGSAEERAKGIVPCLQRNTYGGITVARVNASFVDNKLRRVTVYFSNNHFEKLSAAMTSRFGQPDKRDREVVQNRMGAKFDNEVLTWTSAGTFLRVAKYSSSLEEGWVLISSAEDAAELERTRKRDVEKGAKDL